MKAGPFLVAAALWAFCFLWLQMKAVRTGYAVERTRRQVQSQKESNAYFRLALEERLAPVALAGAARERLGMAPPRPDAVFLLDAEPERGEPPALAHAAPRWMALGRIFVRAHGL